jgi:hypothetical protein
MISHSLNKTLCIESVFTHLELIFVKTNVSYAVSGCCYEMCLEAIYFTSVLKFAISDLREKKTNSADASFRQTSVQICS